MARILFVDDDMDVRELVVYRLHMSGHHVVAVGDASAAIEAVNAASRDDDRFDVAVLDVRMPEIDGVRLLGLLREQPRTAGLPVVFYTANVGQGSRPPGVGPEVPVVSKTQPLRRLVEAVDLVLSGPEGSAT